MPGPCSNPHAKDARGQLVSGKSSLRAARLHSRQNMSKNDWDTTTNQPKRLPKHDRTRTPIDRLEEQS